MRSFKVLVRQSNRIAVDSQWYFLYALVLLLVPLPWILGWLSAALLHEMGHIIALKIFRIQILDIKIGVFGVNIKTEPISPLKEAICALSGPTVGLFTLFFAKTAPHLAFSALVQSCFNLIPVYPMDGGRALCCIMLLCLSEQIAQKILNCIAVLIVAFFTFHGMWMSITYSLGIFPIIFPAVPIAITALKNTLQTKEKNSTICKRIALRGK